MCGACGRADLKASWRGTSGSFFRLLLWFDLEPVCGFFFLGSEFCIVIEGWYELENVVENRLLVKGLCGLGEVGFFFSRDVSYFVPGWNTG